MSDVQWHNGGPHGLWWDCRDCGVYATNEKQVTRVAAEQHVCSVNDEWVGKR